MLIIDMPMPTTEKEYVDVRIFAEGRATMPCASHPYYKEMTVKELVRCGECLHRSNTLTGHFCANKKSCCCGILVRKDFYCADGKRKEQTDETD